MTAPSKTSTAVVLVLSLAAGLYNLVVAPGNGGSNGRAMAAGAAGSAASGGSGGGFFGASGAGSAASKRVAGLGLVEPEAGTIDLAAQMPGVIASVRVREGDRVTKGQIVAELENQDLVARVAQAEAVLTIRQADLKRIRKGPRPEEIRKAEAQLREEESNLKLLELQYQRRKSLAQAGAVSAESYNTAASSLAVSQQRRDAALQQLEILRKGSRPEEIEAAEGEVKLAEHQLAEARATLAKSTLKANTDGVVLRRYREPGEALTSQTATPIVQIADISKLVVRTQVDEEEIGPLKLGQPAQISAAAFGDKTYRGTVTRISPRLGAKTISGTGPTERRDTRVLDVIVSLDRDVELPINLRVDVIIDTSGGKSAAGETPAKPAVAVAEPAKPDTRAETPPAPAPAGSAAAPPDPTVAAEPARTAEATVPAPPEAVAEAAGADRRADAPGPVEAAASPETPNAPADRTGSIAAAAPSGGPQGPGRGGPLAAPADAPGAVAGAGADFATALAAATGGAWPKEKAPASARPATTPSSAPGGTGAAGSRQTAAVTTRAPGPDDPAWTLRANLK